VETVEELAHGLFFDGLRQLTASQAKAFGEVGKALTALGGQFDALVEQFGRVEAVVVQTRATAEATHGAVLDLRVEMQRLGGLQLANLEEVRSLLVQVQEQLGRGGMQRGKVRPQDSFSIRGEGERKAVKALLARFRQLPPAVQQQAPALLNGLGRLQVGVGDLEGAKGTFVEVVGVVTDPLEKAEAFFNAARTALEQKAWQEALAAIREAATLDAGRFAPFPLHRYEPKRILGAGGFGVAVLCHDRNFDEEVVVKTLHAGNLDRGLDEVFREARILRRLSHPAIIGVRDCEYADPVAKARPYLVMDYFPGGTLEQQIEQHGALPGEDLLPIATQIARGMQAAHPQAGVLHRDLKPANILVSGNGGCWQVKIIDFGLALRKQVVETSMARASGEETALSQSVAGTVLYAPPEQMGRLPGVKPGPYSDVYAFGKTCCFALFRTTEPKRRQWGGIPAELADVLEKCIEQELDHRYPEFGPVLGVLASLEGRLQEGGRRRDEEEQRRQEAQRRSEQEEEERRHREEQRRQEEEQRLEQERAEQQRQQREEEQRRQAEEERREQEEEQRRRQEQEAAAFARRQEEEARRGPIVSARGEGGHLSITEALRSAPPGAEIRIWPGVYRESLVLDKPVSLLGDGPRAEVVIEGSESPCISATADAGVRGLTLRTVSVRRPYSHGKACHTVDIRRGALRLEGCSLASDSRQACVAIHGKESNPTLRDCQIAGGLLVSGEGKGTIEGCDIAVAGHDRAAVEVIQGADPTVRRCRIHGTGEGRGVYVHGRGKGMIEGCDIFDNLADVVVCRGSKPLLRGDNQSQGKPLRAVVWPTFSERCSLLLLGILLAAGCWLAGETGARMRRVGSEGTAGVLTRVASSGAAGMAVGGLTGLLFAGMVYGFPFRWPIFRRLVFALFTAGAIPGGIAGLLGLAFSRGAAGGVLGLVVLALLWGAEFRTR
jgi:hypothetical protein